MTIHREGHKLLLSMLIGLGILNAAARMLTPEWALFHDVLLGISVIFFLLILQFFRIPKVHTPVNEKFVIAPANGKVVVIEETKEVEYFGDTRIQVSIFMSPFDVHVNRNPISGVVKFFKYHPGKFLVAWHPKSSTENERTTVVVENAQGTQVLFRQIAGALAKRIRWYVDTGSQVEQGKEFGFIKFGSRVDVFLPLGSRIDVTLNQKTIGGETILAELP